MVDELRLVIWGWQTMTSNNSLFCLWFWVVIKSWQGLWAFLLTEASSLPFSEACSNLRWVGELVGSWPWEMASHMLVVVGLQGGRHVLSSSKPASACSYGDRSQYSNVANLTVQVFACLRITGILLAKQVLWLSSGSELEGTGRDMARGHDH